jgi:hypothetical protein
MSISVTDPKHVPVGIHWAIITFSNEYIPGDERSRTNPGHGYPAHTVTKANYTAYTNEKEWKATIRSYTIRESKFFAIKALPATINTFVQITVS